MSASSVFSAPERSRTALDFRSVGVWSEAVCNFLVFETLIFHLSIAPTEMWPARRWRGRAQERAVAIFKTSDVENGSSGEAKPPRVLRAAGCRGPHPTLCSFADAKQAAHSPRQSAAMAAASSLRSARDGAWPGLP